MGVYETLFGFDQDNLEASEVTKKPRQKRMDRTKYYQRLKDEGALYTVEDVANTVVDFTPIIGDIKGGYETVQFIKDELSKENPNYYLVGAFGGLGAVGTIIGLVPGIGDAAQKAIMSGARMAADRANKVVEALPEYDPTVVGSNLGNIFANKATKEQLDPVRQTGSSKGFYKNKAPNYVPDIEVQSTDQGLLMPEKPLSIEDLKGSLLMPLVADRTDAGKVLTGIRGGVRDYDFEVPIELQGGRGFMRYPDTGAFASVENEMQKRANATKRLGKDGTPIKGVYMTMSPEGSDFSTMMSDTVIEMMKQSPIKKKDMKELSEWVKTNIDPDFIGFDNLDAAKDYLKNNMIGSKRLLIWREMDKVPYVEKGFPTMGDARVAISEKALRETAMLKGSSVANFDTSGNLISGPVRIHDTYSGQIGPTGAAGYEGELPDIPYEILMRKFIDQRRANNQGKPRDFRSLQMSQFGEEVDDQMIEEVNTYLDIIEDAERDRYVRNLPERREQTTTYSIGEQMNEAFDEVPVATNRDELLADAELNAQEVLGISEDMKKTWRSGKEKNKQVRTPQLQQGINAMLENEITYEEYLELADAFRPIQPLTEVPELPTTTDVVSSLKPEQVNKGILGVTKNIEDGTRVASRLDISAYEDFNTWVVSLHDGFNDSLSGRSIGHGQVAVLTNVNFKTNPRAAANIAKGKGKATIARIFGDYKNASPEEVAKMAEEIMADPNSGWVQVGMNPFRHSFFYDKADGMPVTEATEVIQIGPLVLAKDVKKVARDDPEFSFLMDKKDPTSVKNYSQGGLALAVGY